MIPRSFELEGFAADDSRVLRIGSAQNERVHPTGFRLTKGEARIAATLLLGWLGDYPHDPDGCDDASSCICRQKAEKEQRYDRRPGL